MLQSSGHRRAERGNDVVSFPVLEWRGSEEDLLRRVVRKDKAAAALLYDRFADEVNRMVWRLLGADSDHDDLVNEVFLRVLGSIQSVRDHRKLRGWILSITVNTVRSELRRRAIRRRFMVTREPSEHESMGYVQDHEARSLLMQAFTVLDRMPANLRLVFSLRYIDERPLPEVADLCSCSLATVKRRLARAEKRFARLASREPALDERLKRASARGDS